MTPVSELVERWTSRLPSPAFYADGSEKISSRIRRAVKAYNAQEAFEKEHPEALAQRQRQFTEALAIERKERSLAHETQFHCETPDALKAMGLCAQEMAILANLEARKAVQAVEEWRLGNKLYLVMGGASGSGKTIAASSLLLHAKRWVACESFEGFFWETGRARFVKATELARLSYYGDEAREKLEALTIVPMLVIDDLGAEQTSDGWKATLLELLDGRARENNRTCITTNLSQRATIGARKFADHVGSRVMRRLTDFGDFVSAGGAP